MIKTLVISQYDAENFEAGLNMALSQIETNGDKVEDIKFAITDKIYSAIIVYKELLK